VTAKMDFETASKKFLPEGECHNYKFTPPYSISGLSEGKQIISDYFVKKILTKLIIADAPVRISLT
jgi:hypothetical protein